MPILAWMSGPTFGVDHVANSNGRPGNGSSVGASTVANTAAGAAPSSGQHGRAPATSRDHTTAAVWICPTEVNSSPRPQQICGERALHNRRSLRFLGRGGPSR
jgi:hypothetical protein